MSVDNHSNLVKVVAAPIVGQKTYQTDIDLRQRHKKRTTSERFTVAVTIEMGLVELVEDPEIVVVVGAWMQFRKLHVRCTENCKGLPIVLKLDNEHEPEWLGKPRRCYGKFGKAFHPDEWFVLPLPFLGH
ncbi:hypothetical protein QYF36_007446 [Acer negundo]|nr:hypothetical protein QYF36_007446 [Acer negundo]